MAKEEEKTGTLAAIKQSVEAVRNNGAVKFIGKVAGKVWDELQPAFEAGAHEAASLLYRGDAFVMYPQSQQGNEQPTGMAALYAAASEKEKEQAKGMEG